MNFHTLHFLLERAGEDRSVIRFMDRKAQYREYRYPALLQDTKKYAAYYKKIGLGKDDIISLMLPTCEEFLAAFFAAQMIGAVPVSLYPPASLTDMTEWSDRTSAMINSIESKALITDLNISSLCDDILSSTQISIHTIESINRSVELFRFDIETYKKSDICFLQFSSGTTGAPKAVIITQENAVTNTNIIIEETPIDPIDLSVTSWLPLYHDMGLVGVLMVSLFVGNDLTLIRPDDFIRKPYLWLKAMSDFKTTCTTAPNFAYGLIQKRVPSDKIATYDLSNLKVAMCGAEMVYRETMEKFIAHVKPAKFDCASLIPVYGMAEATLAVAMVDKKRGMSFIKINKEKLAKGHIKLDPNGEEICCIGRMLKSFDLKIIDEKGAKVDDGKIGRVLIKGPSITSGYYNDLEKTLSLFIDDYLDTGDEGFIHQGELYLCGRLKDTMVIRGKNYYPTLFEEKIYHIEGLRKGRVIVSSFYNRKNDTEELVVLAEVSQTTLISKDGDEIKGKIRKIIASESLPIFTIELYSPGVLLRSSSGKLKRRMTLKKWEEGKLLTKEAKSLLRTSLFLFKMNFRNIKNKIRARVS